MDTSELPFPKMGVHSTGQARVTLNGTVHYLGLATTRDAQERYTELIQEWHRRKCNGIAAGARSIEYLLDKYQTLERSVSRRQSGTVTRLEVLQLLGKLWKHRWTDTIEPSDLQEVRDALTRTYADRPKAVELRLRHVVDVLRYAAERMMPQGQWLAGQLTGSLVELSQAARSGRRERALQQLYRLLDRDGKLIYVGVSGSALARLSEHAKTKAWFAEVVRIDIEHHACTRRQIEEREAEVIAKENPRYNSRNPVEQGRTRRWQNEAEITAQNQIEDELARKLAARSS
jgi:hypothetical protein